MGDTIALRVRLRAFVRRETNDIWVATCPAIGVASQGPTEGGAKDFLREAVELWFESCVERGVLDSALREANFRPLAHDENAISAGDVVQVTHESDGDEPDIRGDGFPLHIAIPAYQAAAFLDSGM